MAVTHFRVGDHAHTGKRTMWHSSFHRQLLQAVALTLLAFALFACDREQPPTPKTQDAPAADTSGAGIGDHRRSS